MNTFYHDSLSFATGTLREALGALALFDWTQVCVDGIIKLITRIMQMISLHDGIVILS